MTELPPITIAIPAYNLEKYIGDAIQAAAHQDYRGKLSLVVLDDGSSDQTLSVARQYLTKFSNLVVHTQVNQGRVGARNRLLELAETELVAWLDGDDMAPPDWLRQQFELLNQQAVYVAVSGQGYAMTASNLPIGPIPRPLSSDEISSKHLNGQSNAFFQSCTLTRKSAIVAAGGYRLDYPAAEDYDLWLRVERIGRLANHHQCHLYYRVHSTSANATIGSKQRQQGFEACNEARCNRGLPPLEPHQEQLSPPPRKDHWNRSVYWINIALKSGNPWTAAVLSGAALKSHPFSLLLMIMLAIALGDCILLRGNRTERFRPGQKSAIGRLPRVSLYRLAKWVYWRLKSRSG